MKFIVAIITSVGALDVELHANPIRRVVNMLQAMSEKVKKEGEKEEELMEKFTCYCKTNTGELTASIAEAQSKIAEFESQISANEAAKKQLDEELVQHKADREDARQSLATATKMREKEAAQYAKESGDQGKNIEALKQAIAAIERGQTGFLQTETGSLLHSLVLANSKINEWDRKTLISFLSNRENTASSSEIVGILKEMKDEFERDLGDIVEQEEQAQKGFEELAAAKTKEIAANSRAIEAKTVRSGELAVKIVEGKDDLEDTMAALSGDEQFQVNLRKNCATKEQEWIGRQQVRSQELQAIAETVKVLNDDDALDLFKKTLPGPGKSFIQSQKAAAPQRRAQNILREVTNTIGSPQIDLIMLTLKGKKVDFGKVVKMIDDLVALLGTEQTDDNSHREYCNREFDTSDDKKKDTERSIQEHFHTKEQAESDSSNLAAEIKALQDGIVALDKSVVEATEQRKQEHAEFVQTSAENQAAVDLLGFAKNRLNKFYNPKLYKPAPKRELTEEERVYSNFGGELEPTPAPGGIAGTGITVFLQKAAPAPPPETFDAYSKKSGESGGVIAMIDMLSNDVKKDMQAGEHEEKDSQEEYEELMLDSQRKRAADSKSVTTKENAKAEADSVANTATDNLSSSNQELKATKEYISNLHKDCDFLLENFEFRKAARAQEVDALKKAKAVLNGADYSLLQTYETDAMSEDLIHRYKFQQKLHDACVDMCREINQYPNCQCPNFTYDKTPNVMTWDELYGWFDKLTESGREMLKQARKKLK